MMRALANHKPFSALTARMYSVLVEEERDTDWRIPAAMLAALIASVGQPALAGCETEALREQVYRYACRMLDIADCWTLPTDVSAASGHEHRAALQ